ncbi:MAG: hypothetical protein NC218_01905 [Acetobacter sp.]|nr:hypothetical protein [Acetobacter sp.]
MDVKKVLSTLITEEPTTTSNIASLALGYIQGLEDRVKLQDDQIKLLKEQVAFRDEVCSEASKTAKSSIQKAKQDVLKEVRDKIWWGNQPEGEVRMSEKSFRDICDKYGVKINGEV